MKRKIVLGVTGSIAAYKAAELVRLFIRDGDEVKVVMTPAACEFVRPLTFQTLSQNPVCVDAFAPPKEWKPEHIALAEWADAVIVAPASANTLAKIRMGIADNLLCETLLAAAAKPVFAAPAMNSAMWANAATQENMAALRTRGIAVIGPANGDLACGTSASGRMVEPQEIYDAVVKALDSMA